MASSLIEMLGTQLSGSAAETIGRKLGTNPQQTQTAIAAAIPTILEALTRQADQPQAADGLHKAITRDHDGSLLDNLQDYLEKGAGNPRATAGDDILSHILGSKRSRVENGVGQLSGLDAGTAAKLLGMLAPLVLGAVGKMQRDGGLNSGQLTDLLRNERTRMQTGDPAQASFFERMLDQDGDGDFDASDMMRLGSSIIGRFFK